MTTAITDSYQNRVSYQQTEAVSPSGHAIHPYSEKEIMCAKKDYLYYTVLLYPFMRCCSAYPYNEKHSSQTSSSLHSLQAYTHTHGPEPCYINTSCLLNTLLCQPNCYSGSIFRQFIYILDKINNELFLEMIFTRLHAVKQIGWPVA